MAKKKKKVYRILKPRCWVVRANGGSAKDDFGLLSMWCSDPGDEDGLCFKAKGAKEFSSPAEARSAIENRVSKGWAHEGFWGVYRRGVPTRAVPSPPPAVARSRARKRA